MKPEQIILKEIDELYGEWIEQAGANAPLFVIDVLAKMLAKERSEVKYYKDRLKYEEKKEYFRSRQRIAS